MSPAASRLRHFAPSLVINGVAPLAIYLLLRPHVHDDAIALAVGGAVPVVATAAIYAVRRRIDPIGVVALLAYVVALIVVVLSGGNSLVLKLQDAVVTGPIGLICLVSVAIGRPLHLVILSMVARRDPRFAHAGNGIDRRKSAILTALIGTMLVVHALVLLVMAMVLPTATFLALSRPVGLSVIGIGLGALMLYRTRLRRRRDVGNPEHVGVSIRG